MSAFVQILESLQTFTIYANNKPWFSKDIKNKLNVNNAFKHGDKEHFKSAKYEAEKAKRRAKAQYRNIPEDQFSSSDTHAVWQGLQHITQYKQK